MRDSLAEIHLRPEHLVMPYFITDGVNVKQAIKTLPGQFRWSVDLLVDQLKIDIGNGIRAIALFPKVLDELKTSGGEYSFNKGLFLFDFIREIKKQFPELQIITDVALDPYSSDGHDGIVSNGEILNDESVRVLCKMAVAQADAGADYVAPSDMMDGRIAAIRLALDDAGHESVGVISYCAKYASHFYGPFRDALESAPKTGDKKTYQMDYRNRTEAMRELEIDLSEGADMVMVKPALAYLDIISDFRTNSTVPVVAYNVSGEYAMIKFAAAAGALNEEAARDEMLYAIKRAGAQLIFTYFASEFAAGYVKKYGKFDIR